MLFPILLVFYSRKCYNLGKRYQNIFEEKSALIDCHDNTKPLSFVRKDFKVPHFVGFKTGWNYELFSTQLLSSPDWRILMVVTHIVGLRKVRFLQNGELHFESNSSIPQIGGYQRYSPFCWFEQGAVTIKISFFLILKDFDVSSPFCRISQIVANRLIFEKLPWINFRIAWQKCILCIYYY